MLQESFNREMEVKIEQLEDGIAANIWALTCRLEIERFSRKLNENNNLFIKRLDELLVYVRQGNRGGRITPEIFSPKMLRTILKKDVFENTVYKTNPQYLYQV